MPFAHLCLQGIVLHHDPGVSNNGSIYFSAPRWVIYFSRFYCIHLP